jgi:cathepsin A (carboxypeptidase C)
MQGDADFICNWLGNYGWTEALEWAGKEAYNQVALGPLRLGGAGRKIGEVKSSGNLTFMRIHAAGHMVPLNQPEAGLDFFNRWLHGAWFAAGQH